MGKLNEAASGVLVAAREAASKTVEELRSALSRISANTPVVLQMERDGKLMFMAFKLDGA